MGNRIATSFVNRRTNVQEALNQKTTTMHVLQIKEQSAGPSLGPAITVDLNLEEQHFKNL